MSMLLFGHWCCYCDSISFTEGVWVCLDVTPIPWTSNIVAKWIVSVVTDIVSGRFLSCENVAVFYFYFFIVFIWGVVELLGKSYGNWFTLVVESHFVDFPQFSLFVWILLRLSSLKVLQYYVPGKYHDFKSQLLWTSCGWGCRLWYFQNISILQISVRVMVACRIEFS